MTSEERHAMRDRRRRATREAKRIEREREALDFDTVFTFPHMYRAALRCYRGVSWKGSVQAYKARGGINVARRLREIKAGRFPLRYAPEFITRERGRERRINSIRIDDRVPQKCLCMYSIKPVLHRSLIYDNYASQEDKGTTKARKRLRCQLERHIRRYGMIGGIAIFDFKGFFDSIRHSLVRSVLRRYYTDERIIDANMRIVGRMRRDVGLVLGSENSQDFAISTPNALDHYAKEALRMDGYGRYMDDGWIIHHDKGELQAAFERVRELAEGMGFRLNMSKSRIMPFGAPFTMLKRKYSFAQTGHISIKPVRESVIRERRKLKRLYRRYRQGTMSADAGYESLRAWEASLNGCDCTTAVRQMERLYWRLYIDRWISGEEG